MLVTIDPELAKRLRAAAKKVRRPMSALVEEGVRLILSEGAVASGKTSAVAAALSTQGSEVRDLFAGTRA